MLKRIIFSIISLLFASIIYSQDLSVNVSINSDGASLKDVCDFLSQQTGLDIVAGKTDQDWTVTDRKTIIHAEEVPLKDLMTSIANVYDMTWETSENGTIFLTTTPEQSENQLNLRKKYYKNLEDEFNKRQEEALLAITDKNVSNTYTALFYGSDYYNNLILFFNVFPQIKPILLKKDSVKFSFSKLNENQKNVLKNLVFSYVDFNKKIQPELQQDLDFFTSNENITFYVNAIKGNEDQDIENDSIFAKLAFEGDKGNFIRVEILNPTGFYTNVLADAINRLSKGESMESVRNSMEVELLQFKGSKITDKLVPCKNLDEDKFNQKFNLATIIGSDKNAISFRDFCDKISNKCNLNIIADVFYRDTYIYDSGDFILKNIIQNFADKYELIGVYNNNILELKDKYYYIKLAGMVPNQWIDYWIVRAYQNGGYVLEDLMSMAKLNDTQIDTEIANNPEMNITVDKEFRLTTKEVVRKRNALRFLASLSDEEQQRLFENKLSAYEISDEQWQFLQDALKENDGFYFEEKKANQIVKLSRVSGKNIEYVLEYDSGFASEPIKITITTNKYTIKNKNK